MNRKLAGDEAFESFLQLQAIPKNLQPEDMSATVSFLVSEDAAMITGQTIIVDGGQIRI